jgi:hypothetical protein
LGYGQDIRHSIPQLGQVAFSALSAGLYRVKQFKHLTSPILVFFFIRKGILDLNREYVKCFFLRNPQKPKVVGAGLAPALFELWNYGISK